MRCSSQHQAPQTLNFRALGNKPGARFRLSLRQKHTHKHPYSTVRLWWFRLALLRFARRWLFLSLRFLFLLPLLSDRSKGGLNVPLLRGVLRRYGLP